MYYKKIITQNFRPYKVIINSQRRRYVNPTKGLINNKSRYHYGLFGFGLCLANYWMFGTYYKNDSTLWKSTNFIDPEEVRKHNTADDCWVVIDDVVYNLTEFVDLHPGGKDVIITNAGKDVTNLFKPLHAPDVLEKYIDSSMKLGKISSPMPSDLICSEYAPGESQEDLKSKLKLKANLPPLSTITNIFDFEYLASKILTNQAWAYYSSGSDDEVSLRENHAAYHRIFFNPKVLVDVENIDTTTTILGKDQDVPFYVSATALCKLGNPAEGEKDITRGCGQGNTIIPQMLSTLASCSPDEVSASKIKEDQTLWFQLYINSDRKVTETLVKHVEELGFQAIFVTVDAPHLGHREKDAKLKFSTTQNEAAGVMKDSSMKETADGATRALSKFIDPSITWRDIQQLKNWTRLPIIIKGVQRKEDVLKAAEIGCQGVVISNHGGRQLDFAKAPIEVLAESMPLLKEQNLDKNFEVFIDGGVRRGTDILKALCLGAKSVGLGRPFLYANSCYGKDGVDKAIQLLKYELEMNMRLLGVSSIKELNESYLDLSSIKNRTVPVPTDAIADSIYQPHSLVKFKDND